MRRQYLIFSHHWSEANGGNRWWGPGAKEYFSLDGAGRFTLAEARKATKHMADQDEVVQLGSSRFLTLIRHDDVDTVVWKYMNLIKSARSDGLEEASRICEGCLTATECNERIRAQIAEERSRIDA